MSMIETRNLKKNFGSIEAVRGVSFRVEKGEVLGFLGPNGAGKSTVMRMVTCFLSPTSGTALVGGHDVQTDSMEARKLIGYVPESNPVYTDMTVESFLRFIGSMRGYSGKELANRVDQMLETCWLTDVYRQTIETLSKGYKRRVGLAQALLHDPPVLILDEPTDGLDPNQKHEVRTLIRRMAPEKAIVISTHILEEVDSVCTRAIIIAKGRIVADGTPTELKERSRYHGAIRLTVDTRKQAADPAVLKALAEVSEVEEIGDSNGLTRFLVLPKQGKAIAHQIATMAREKGWEIEEMSVEQGDLNEVFRDITTKEMQRP